MDRSGLPIILALLATSVAPLAAAQGSDCCAPEPGHPPAVDLRRASNDPSAPTDSSASALATVRPIVEARHGRGYMAESCVDVRWPDWEGFPTRDCRYYLATRCRAASASCCSIRTSTG